MDIVQQVEAAMPTQLIGSVTQTVGNAVSVIGFPAPVGAIAEIERESDEPIEAEVIGFSGTSTLLFPYSDPKGIRLGNRVRMKKSARWIPIGSAMLGRVVDARGRAIDGRAFGVLRDRVPLDGSSMHACSRPRIDTSLSTGVRAIDGLMTCGRGQRLGIFAGSGIGKSTLLGMMARYTDADVIVIGLIGERGREVNDFIERDLGGQGLAKSVVVVATSDEPALMRVHAAKTASAIAEYFRDQGKDVLLLIDSITRFSLAQREIGLAAGEPPTTRGFTPSVFAMLPKIVERAGRTPLGSITAFYTVLVDGDDPNEPIADTMRGLLDGHVWLDRKLAHRGHYPAIDVLGSISRLMNDLCDTEHLAAAREVRELMALYAENEDLISIGAYRQGANPAIDRAIAMKSRIDAFLRQAVHEPSDIPAARDALGLLATDWKTGEK